MIAKASANKAAKQRANAKKKPYRRNKALDMPNVHCRVQLLLSKHREIILDERDAEEEAETAGQPKATREGLCLKAWGGNRLALEGALG
jgi:hypothetical protein